MTPRIGRYEIQDELGRGAFGRVYRAYDPSVKRAVAIKVLAAGLDPDVLDRFRYEAGTTGNLTHNNIVTVYEYGEHEGRPYIAMELLEGETLQKTIESKRPLSVLEKVRIMHQVAEGLAAARAKGVIHRDIKPANIMLLPNGDAKIMDFGIARVLDKDGSRRTRQGDMVGTLLYMSPEQFQGFDPDEITDIFAYGVVYYELLTGVHPFAGKDAGILMFRITTVDPPPIRNSVRDCPEYLDQMVRRTLAKDREIRVRSFDEVLLDSTPILHELKCQRAADLMQGVEELIEGNRLDVAQSRIRQVLELDAFNQDARRWRKTVQERLERQVRENKVTAILQEAEAKVEARRFPEALQCYESVLQIDPAHGGALAGQQRVRASIQSNRKAAKLLSEARFELEQNSLEAALEKLTKAVEADPGIPDGTALLETVQAQMADRRVNTAVAKAESARAKGDFDEALVALAEFEMEPRAVELKRNIEESRFQSGFEQARAALARGSLNEAEYRAADLVAAFPEQARGVDLLAVVREYQGARRRADAIAELKRAAGSLIEEKRFAEAVKVLTSGLRDYPEEERIRQLHGEAAALQAAQDRASALQIVIERLGTLRTAGELDKAIRLASRSLAEFGPDERIEAFRRDLERDKLLGEGRRLLAEEKFGEAVTMLEQALPQYPADSAVTQLLAEARAGIAARQKESDIAGLLAGVEAAEKEGRLEQALQEAHMAMERYPDAGDLASAAARLQTKIAREAQRKREAHLAAIAAAIEAGDWSGASVRMEEAQREFPEHEDWKEPGERIRVELERTRVYETTLNQAGEARKAKRYEEAETLLHGLMAASPLDGRAEAALDELSVERNWPHWLEEVVAQRREARQLTVRGNPAADTALLDNLKKRNPRHSEELFRQAQAREAAIYQAALEQAEAARSAGDFSEAGKILKGVLKETGEVDRRAAALLEVTEKQRAYEDALTAAEAERVAGNPLVAEQILKDAIGRGAPDGRATLALAALAEERYRKFREESIRTCLNRANQLRADGDYSGAQRTVEDLLPQFPDSVELVRDREVSLQQIAGVLAQENQAGLDAAAQARASEDYPKAMDILQRLIAHNDPDRRARMALDELTQEVERKEARKLASSGDLEGAIAQLDRLVRKYPENRDLKRDLDIAKNRQDAARLRAKGNPEAAHFVLDKLLQRFPDRDDIRRDRDNTARDIETSKVRAYEKALEEAEQARAAGKLPAALQIVQKLLAPGPAIDGRAQQMQAALLEQIEIADGRREAARLIQKGELQPGILLLRSLATKYPENVDVQQDLEQAEKRGLQRREIQVAYEQGLQAAERARVAGRYLEAEELLTKLPPSAMDYRAQQALRIVREEWARQVQNKAIPVTMPRDPNQPAARGLTERAGPPPTQAVPASSLLEQLLRIWPILLAAVVFIAVVLWLVFG